MRCAGPVAGRESKAPAPACLRHAGVVVHAGRRGVCAAVLTCLLFSSLSAGAVRAAPPEESWIKPKADESVLVDIASAGSRWIVVGERGHVLVSDDAETWKQAKVPTRVLLAAVALNEEGTGFAVGHDATIIRTRNWGESWDRVYHDPDEEAPFLDVILTDDERVVAVGAYGMYVESSDGGESWEHRILEPEELDAAAPAAEAAEEEFYYDYHLNDVAIADNGRWYIAAEAGNVYRSDDHGETWLRLPSPYEGSFFGVLPMNGDRVLVLGLQGRLFQSGDAGVSWTRIDTGTDATLTAALRLPDDRALIVGHAGIVLNNVDPQVGLEQVRLTNRPVISDARLLPDGNLLTVGDEGVRQWPAALLSGQ